MKTNLIMIGMIFLLAACKKTTQYELTTVEIRSTEFFTGDSIGNVGFNIKELYSASNYGLIDSTNEFGNYVGSFEHPENLTFNLEVSSNLYVVENNLPLTTGTHNVVDIEVTTMSSLLLNLDCSGSGYIQSVTRNRLEPFEYGSPLYGLQQGATGSFYSDCAYTQYPVEVFSGEWIISYQWKPTVSSVWYYKADTVSITPGQAFVHTIVY